MDEVFRPYTDRVDVQLRKCLTLACTPNQLRQAMLYGVFNGGKRVRPILVYLTAEALDVPLEQADNVAAAIELIHSYSLIHDDLPSMDDDDLRRGRATVHIHFDEATAILAGDALQTLAFEVIAGDEQLAPGTRLDLIRLFSRSAGAEGMVAGQILDLEAEERSISAKELENMHRRKTGDLISASVMSGAILANPNNVDTTLMNCLQAFAHAVGLAFQVKDDILDVIGDPDVMGKTQGADRERNKTTFTSAHGLKAAQVYLDELRIEAIAALEPLGEKAHLLLRLTDFVTDRQY